MAAEAHYLKKAQNSTGCPSIVKNATSPFNSDLTPLTGAPREGQGASKLCKALGGRGWLLLLGWSKSGQLGKVVTLSKWSGCIPQIIKQIWPQVWIHLRWSDCQGGHNLRILYYTLPKELLKTCAEYTSNGIHRKFHLEIMYFSLTGAIFHLKIM